MKASSSLRRGLEWQNGSLDQILENAAAVMKTAGSLLARVHRWWWWRRGLLLAGSEDGGGRDEGEDSDFHMYVWVLTSLLGSHPPDSWQRVLRE